MSQMSPRERVRRSLRHQEPDRVPVDFAGWACGITATAYARLRDHLGLVPNLNMELNDWFLVSNVGEDLLLHLDIDFRRVHLNPLPGKVPFDTHATHWTDAWGVVRRNVPYVLADGITTGYYSEIVENPLAHASTSDLEHYPWPNADDDRRFTGVAEEAERLYTETPYALVAGGVDLGIFELAQNLRGMQRFFIDLVEQPDFARRLVEMVAQVQIRLTARFMDLVGPYVDMVETSDDYGTQLGLLISPRTYREIIKPSHCALLHAIHARTSAKVFHHSCGSVNRILDDLIDAGVDVINPVQPSAAGMDALALKSKFGERISFHGAIDVQTVLPTGTCDDVARHVAEQMAALAPRGGYVVAPAHNIQDDVPPENVVALYAVAHARGAYPLSL